MTFESTGNLIATVGTKEILIVADIVLTGAVLAVALFKRKCDKLNAENIALKEQIKSLKEKTV
jgi:cell division protein FtsB